MARLISVSNEVYEELSKTKGEKRSFSEVIRSLLDTKKRAFDMKSFAGIWKERKDLKQIEKRIQTERKSFGRYAGNSV